MRTSSLYPVIVMTIINWRPPNLPLPLVSPGYQVGISKCSELSNCMTVLFIIPISDITTYPPTPARTRKSPLMPLNCLLTQQHLINMALSKYVLYIDSLSLNFHFQYLGWWQCYLCFGFHNNLTMLLTKFFTPAPATPSMLHRAEWSF